MENDATPAPREKPPAPTQRSKVYFSSKSAGDGTMFLYEIARAVAICVIRARGATSPARRFRVTSTSVARARARTPPNPCK